jgi:hypothetical protein
VKRVAGLLWLALAGLSACHPLSRLRRDDAQVDLRWSGSDEGKVSSGATAEWCGLLRLLEIRAIRGDTGVALAIYPSDSLVPGKYPVRDPVRAESLPPAAGVAVRWATRTSIKGFQGESGSVILERSGSGPVSGRVEALARSATDTGRIHVTGTFQNLSVRKSTRGCVRPAGDTVGDAPPPDTLVH